MSSFHNLKFYVHLFCLATCFFCMARADETAKLPVSPKVETWYESAIDLSKPLESLARELLRNESLDSAELEKRKAIVVAKGRQLFEDKMVPVLLKQYDAKSTLDLNSKLQTRGLTLSALQDQFVWKVLIGELARRSGAQ